jgi:hypothetical protein
MWLGLDILKLRLTCWVCYIRLYLLICQSRVWLIWSLKNVRLLLEYPLIIYSFEICIYILCCRYVFKVIWHVFWFHDILLGCTHYLRNLLLIYILVTLESRCLIVSIWRWLEELSKIWFVIKCSLNILRCIFWVLLSLFLLGGW